MKGLNYYHPPHTHTPLSSQFPSISQEQNCIGGGGGGHGTTTQGDKMSYAGLWRSFGLALILSDFILV